MVSEVSAARSQLAAARRQARAEVEKAAAAADGKMREYVDKFREQVGAGRVWPASHSAGFHLPARANGSGSARAVVAARLHARLQSEGWRAWEEPGGLAVIAVLPPCADTTGGECVLLCACCACRQVRAREEELLNLTSLHTAAKASADKRITSLESRVAKLLEANRCARHMARRPYCSSSMLRSRLLGRQNSISTVLCWPWPAGSLSCVGSWTLTAGPLT